MLNLLKKPLFIFLVAVIVAAGLMPVFGDAIRVYITWIIGLMPLNYLTGGVGLFVMVLTLGIVLHFVIHILTDPKTD